MGTYKHGKQVVGISFETFREIMEKGKFVNPLRDKSYLTFLYWTGVRKSEAIERTKDDFTITERTLIINAPAKKGGLRLPLELDLDLPYVDLIVKKIENTRKTKRNPKRHIWNIKAWTAWKIVKRVMPKHYPHFFRLNRATQFLSDPETTIIDMKSWFGWKSASTIDPYMGLSHRGIEKGRRRLRREVEKR